MNNKEILQNYLQRNVLATSQITEMYGLSKQLLNHYLKLGSIKPIFEAPLGNFYLRSDVEEFLRKREENDWDIESDFRPDLIVEPEEGAGVTRTSLKFFEDNRGELGEIESVTLYQFSKDAVIHGFYRRAYNQKIGPFDCLETPKMVVRDFGGKEIWLKGCNCGYKGEGPRGSLNILSKIGVPEEEAKKLFEHSAIHFFRQEDGPWRTLPIAEKENHSDFRLYEDREIVLRKDKLIMFASDDVKSLRGMDPEVFLKPYRQFIPSPINATLMTREQALKNGQVTRLPFGMGAKVYNLVIKDSSGRELWLELGKGDGLSVKDTRTVRDLLEQCGFELEEKASISDRVKEWLGICPLTRDFRASSAYAKSSATESSIIPLVSEEEYEKIQQQMQAQRCNGVPKGYKEVDGEILVDETTADFVREAFDTFLATDCSENGEE